MFLKNIYLNFFHPNQINNRLKDLIESNKKLFHEIDVFIRKNITPLSSSSSSKINYDKHQQQYQVPLPPNCIMFDEDGNLDRLCLN